MSMLKFGAYICFAAAVVCLVLAIMVPAAVVGLLIGAAALIAAGVFDLWLYRYFAPAMNKIPKPAGMEDVDANTLRGTLKMGSALRKQGISKMESATATMNEMNRSNRLRENGNPAKAEVLAMRDTQQLINFDPILEFDLRIHPEGGDVYEIGGYRQVVSKIVYPQIEVGESYDAFVDPADPNSVYISWSKVPSPL